MPIRRQTDVTKRLDLLQRRAIRKLAPAYKRGVQAPIVAALEGAKSPEGLLKALGPGLAEKMDERVVADALSDTMVQAALVGTVAETRPQTTADSED